VAIKVLPPELAFQQDIRERFKREAQTAGQLLHPHIVPLLAAGDVDGLFWYTMPLVTGESLRSRLFREGRLSVSLALRLAIETADALDYAHRQGVTHRDVKPENILLQDNHAMVLDFGIAGAISDVKAQGGDRLTTGTPAYMSPEQRAGEPVDGRADIYSLARMLVEMLTGELPEAGSADLPRIPGVDREMVETIRRALAPDPDRRPPTAGEFAAALAPCEHQRPSFLERLLSRRTAI